MEGSNVKELLEGTAKGLSTTRRTRLFTLQVFELDFSLIIDF